MDFNPHHKYINYIKLHIISHMLFISCIINVSTSFYTELVGDRGAMSYRREPRAPQSHKLDQQRYQIN